MDTRSQNNDATLNPFHFGSALPLLRALTSFLCCRPSSLPPAGSDELGAERLVACYANLYSQARVDTLDALDALPALRDATELKSKILFSVVVVSPRAGAAPRAPTPSSGCPAYLSFPLSVFRYPDVTKIRAANRTFIFLSTSLTENLKTFVILL